MFAPMLEPPPTEIANKFDAPKTLLELVVGIPLVAGAMVLELILMLPMPPMRLLEAEVELAPEAIMDPVFVLCPLVIGVLGVPTTLAIVSTIAISTHVFFSITNFTLRIIHFILPAFVF